MNSYINPLEWKSEQIIFFFQKTCTLYGQVQLNQNMILVHNYLIVIILFCTLTQRWKQI